MGIFSVDPNEYDGNNMGIIWGYTVYMGCMGPSSRDLLPWTVAMLPRIFFVRGYATIFVEKKKVHFAPLGFLINSLKGISQANPLEFYLRQSHSVNAVYSHALNRHWPITMTNG